MSGGSGELITRRKFLAGAAAIAASRAAARPNIIFILADDLGCFDLGCYGQKKIRTPNIDRLAAEGMKFNQAYAGGVVCAPSRSCLMTGMHTGHTTVRNNSSVRTGERVPLRAEDITVAKVLKGAGYATGVIGKWGLGEAGTTGIPNRQGFDEWFGYLNQDHAVDYYTDYLWRNQQKEILKGNLSGGRREYTHDLFTREAVRFIRAHNTEPFFLYQAYTIPHSNHEVPSDAPYAGERWTQEQKNYAAMVTRMDADVGRLVGLLKEAGLDANTLVFFSSDNGAGFKEGIELFRSTGSLRGRKGDVYEGGIRAPMIARWPGKIRPGSTSEQVWAFWDFLPTAAELAGAKAPPNIDGLSIVPTLLGQKQKQREYSYWEAYPKGGFCQAVRMGDWKGVRQGLKGPLELYNLAHDVAESHSVAAEHPDVVAKIEAILRTARTDAAEYPVDGKTRKKGK